jgi:hypothetical protein
MKSNSTIPTLTITTASGEAEVKYSANMRFADFAKHNDYDVNNLEIANEHYKAAKQVFAAEVEKQLANIRAVDVKQSAVFKGGTFHIRSQIVKEQSADSDNVQHEALVRQWAHKKAVDSQKAQEKASVFLANKSEVRKAA